jgi:Domain of unknown function (DUF6285)
MPRSIPTTAQLLKAAAKYLEEELMPTLNGYHSFKTRVTANALKTVQRELELRDAQDTAEHKRLLEILGHDGTIEELSRELADKIRAGTMTLDHPKMRDHIKQSLADALAINNPKWMTR